MANFQTTSFGTKPQLGAQPERNLAVNVGSPQYQLAVSTASRKGGAMQQLEQGLATGGGSLKLNIVRVLRR